MTDAVRLLEAALAADGGGSELAADPSGRRDAALRRAVDVAWQAGDAPAVRALAAGYGALLCLEPQEGSDGVRLVRVGIAERRRRGAFSTPAGLAAALAGHALPAALAGPAASVDALSDNALSDNAFRVSGSGRPAVVDPACGSGALLRAAFDRLLALGLPAPDAVAALHGVDDDPVAVHLARTVLAVDAVEAGAACTPDDLASRVVVGDALLGATPLLPAAGVGLEWHRAFPTVLADPAAPADPLTGWRGGFDAVVANPPWERLKVTRRDWRHRPPTALRADRAASARGLREAGRHPLTGVGELNAYLPFLETCWRLLAPHGRAGIVVPAGVAADRSAAPLLGALLASGALERLHLLDQAAQVFEGVSSRVGVAVVVLRSGGVRPGSLPTDRTDPTDRADRTAEVAVGLADAVDPPAERAWRLDASMPRLVNPNSGTLPLFGSGRDADLVTAAHRRFPVLVRRDPAGRLLDSAWQLRLVTSMHMTRDAKRFVGADGPGLLPLWEAKHAGLLDHRGGARAGFRYWVPTAFVEDRFGPLAARGWLAGYRNVTTTDSARTLLPTALPVAGVGNSLPLLDAPRLPLLLAALASLPVDYLVRQKHAGANLNFFKLEQAPVPPPDAYDGPAPWRPGSTLATWVLARFAAAHAWDDGLAGLAAELVADGVPVPAWRDRTPQQAAADRAAALADLDAAHALLFGWSRDDFEHVLGAFPALRAKEVAATGRFCTAERALAAYDRLAGST